MPIERPSMSEKSGSIDEPPPMTTAERASRRASVATGMLSAPFQKSQKEAPRWRPYTFEAQNAKTTEAAGGGEGEGLSVEESLKPLNQKIFEKTAVSLALGLFVILVSFLFGSMARIVIRRDLGLLALWINQVVLILVFMFDKRSGESQPGEGKRMDNFTQFEKMTLVCQLIPIVYIWISGNATSYYGMLVMIILQAGLKFVLMYAFGSVVEISL